MRAAGVPLAIRVAVAHAAVQHVATAHGIDILHIKGPALDTEIIWEGRHGTDADVLVRATESQALVDVLQREGWELRARFENSSAFQHSATLWHDLWGYVDVHRIFPGIAVDPDLAFARLWSDHSEKPIADVPCAVPSQAAQILIVLLHAARERGSPRSVADVKAAWGGAPVERQAQVRALVDELNAHVAFAAATGTLEEYRGARDYDLWAVSLHGGTRLQEWKARIKAAPTVGEALRLALRAPLVNTDHLAMVRGHEPTRMEIILEFVARPVRGVAESWRTWRSKDGKE